MKMLNLFSIFILLSVNTFATEQYLDSIIYKGKVFILQSTPLESYFMVYPEKRPINDCYSSALWRNYIARFEIMDNKIFIKNIETFDCKNNKERIQWKSELNNIFPDKTSYFMEWFTGIVVIPVGKMVIKGSWNFNSLYEQYLLIEFKNGVLINESDYSAEEYLNFLDKQFQAYKNTDKYERTFIDLEGEPEKIESFIKSFVQDYNFIIID